MGKAWRITAGIAIAAALAVILFMADGLLTRRRGNNAPHSTPVVTRDDEPRKGGASDTVRGPERRTERQDVAHEGIGVSPGKGGGSSYTSNTVSAGRRQHRTAAEEAVDEFPSLSEDAKINVITNIDAFDPALITAALSDTSADVRLAAIKSLGWFRTDERNLVPYLDMALKDRAAEVREEAYQAMDSIKDRRWLFALVKSALKSEYPDARQKAGSKFISLGLPRERIRPQVIEALSDRDGAIRSEAVLSASFLWNREFTSERDALRFLTRR
jgi:hypothetical protein